MSRVGYCCICLGINESVSKKDRVSINRGMTKKTFDREGLERVSSLAIQNLIDLGKILQYNLENQIWVYRMSSEMFPWITHYRLEDLPNFDKMGELLQRWGDFAKRSGMRLSFHAPPFCVLSSQNPSVVAATIDELDKYSQIMDIMGLEIGTHHSINVHVGSTKPTLIEAAERFCENFIKLSPQTQRRLTVENDDGPGQYTTQDLFDMVHSKTGIPIVFDYFHHTLHPGNLTHREAFDLARRTWKEKQLCHHSSSKKNWEDSGSKSEAHADFLWDPFDDFGQDIDVELECKSKDIALFRYVREYMN